MGICNPCTLAGMLTAAETLVGQNTLNNDPSSALGGIALTRESHAAVAENVDCGGIVASSTTGQLDCPLRELTYGARAFAFSPWNQGQFSVDLASKAHNSETTRSSPGQYL